MHQRFFERPAERTAADEDALSQSAVLIDQDRTIRLHYTDTGPAICSAPVIALLHGSGPGSTGWANFAANRPALIDAGFRVICVDLPGWGRSDAVICTEDRSALNARALHATLNAAEVNAPVHLIGSSMGAHSAVAFALQWPERVHALVLYEPTLFALVDSATPPPNAADGIRHTVTRATAALAAGDRSAAAEIFIDYWMGDGAWAAKPDAQRGAIETAVTHVQGWGRALFGEPTPLDAFQALQMPVLLMQGSDTTASARAVSTLLARTLPRLETRTCDGLGHLGPITHPAIVDAAIEECLGHYASAA